MIKLGEGFVKDPESVAVDKKDGTIYASTRDGWIKKIHKNGTCQDWMMIGGNTLLGITISITNPNHLFVCDATKVITNNISLVYLAQI